MKLNILFICLFLTSCGIQSIPKGVNEVEAKWAEVLNQYKRREDLIPNLVNTVKAYAAHVKETLTAVIKARAQATQMKINFDQLNAQSMKQFQKAQGALSSALSRLMVTVEKYPNLKANQNFLALQSQLEGTENRITVARKRYIESIKNFNNLISVPPTSFTNMIFYHHDKKPQFTVENYDEVKNAPKVNF